MDTNHLYGSEHKLVLIRIWEKETLTNIVQFERFIMCIKDSNTKV